MNLKHSPKTSAHSPLKKNEKGGTLQHEVPGLDNFQAMAEKSPQIAQMMNLRNKIHANKGPLQLKSVGGSGSQSLPTQLKSGVEQLSGMNMGDVKVQYDSPQPSKIGAAAYAQGTDIHLGPGQEQHLPHEAWHVVQQKKGDVKATNSINGTAVNDDSSLEKEADRMGAEAQGLGRKSDNAALTGMIQRMSLNKGAILQGKFNSGKVAQLVDGEKVEEVLENGEAGVELAGNVNDIAGSASELAGGGVNADASTMSGVIFEHLQSMSSLIKSGSKLWKEKNWENGATFFLDAAETASKILGTLASSGIMAEIPVLGSAISAFKSGMGIFKSNKSLSLLREFESGKKADLTEEDKLTLNRYVSSLKVEIGSNSVDFVLNLGKAVGDFFPPAGTAIGIVKSVKGVFETGYNSWISYKSTKEKQALSRISGGNESELGAEELASAGDLAKKTAKAEPDSLKSSNGTLLDLVNMKFEIEDLKLQNSAEQDAVAKGELTEKENALRTKLNESIAIYNSAMGNIEDSVKISYSDVEKLQVIHANVIQRYLDKKVEEKSYWERAKSSVGGVLGAGSPLKDKILQELNKEASAITAKDIQELSQGQHASNLWNKTQKALSDASKGRSHFTRAELDKSVTAVLKKYKVSDEEIKQIVRA
jgi:hypothetical protein